MWWLFCLWLFFISRLSSLFFPNLCTYRVSGQNINEIADFCAVGLIKFVTICWLLFIDMLVLWHLLCSVCATLGNYLHQSYRVLSLKTGKCVNVQTHEHTQIRLFNLIFTWCLLWDLQLLTKSWANFLLMWKNYCYQLVLECRLNKMVMVAGITMQYKRMS